MLKQIQTTPKRTEQATEDCFTMLMSCHGHIRHFAATAERLAQTRQAASGEVTAAAESLLRYFTVALPLHEADENISVDPRVQQLVPKSALASASREMVEQHKEINEVLRRLIPRWQTLVAEPVRFEEFGTEMRDDAARLRELFDRHLDLEEQVVFPAMREHIACEVLETIRQEMKARRV